MSEGSLADDVAAAALAVTGVTDLHGGTFGVGTYLAGRPVVGVRLGAEACEVHVVVAMGSVLLDVADQVRAAVAPLVSTPVQVVVEDVVQEGVADVAEAES